MKKKMIIIVLMLMFTIFSGCTETDENNDNDNISNLSYDEWLERTPFYHVTGEIIEVLTYERSWGSNYYGGLQSYVLVVFDNATRITTYGEEPYDFNISQFNDSRQPIEKYVLSEEFNIRDYGWLKAMEGKTIYLCYRDGGILNSDRENSNYLFTIKEVWT